MGKDARSASMAPPPAPALPALLSRAASAAAPSPLPPRLTTGNMIKQTQAQTQTPPSRLSASVSRAGSRSGSGGSAGTPASDAAPTPPSPRRHQKALSTSVVAETPRHRRTLSAVDERLTEARDRDPHTALEDLRSLRSSGRRRMRALVDLECALVVACTGDPAYMEAYASLQAHTPLLALLGRHTASLAKRASTSSLPAGDELARHLGPEIDTALGILQGLSLLSKACKAAVGERWTMEMFLDLLLLLRTQPAEGTQRPTVYLLLDLLFCVLVDSPEHARMFEELQGLEAVTRVLRGTGVAKDVRMKCCEFLYFYLLPEGATSMPESYSLPGLPGSRSASASSTFLQDASATLAAPDVTQSVLPSPSHSRVTSLEQPNQSQTRAASPDRTGWHELADLPFIPATPRKPTKPSLGFQTPSANRRTSGSSAVSVLTPVAQSPAPRRHARAPSRDDDAESRTSSGSSNGSAGSAKRTGTGSGTGSSSPADSPSVTPTPTPSATPAATPAATPSMRDSLARRPSKRSSISAKSPLDDTLARRHVRSQSAAAAGALTPGPTPRDRQRSRGFPAELTRGALPGGGGTPGSTPLTPARRIPSEREREAKSRGSTLKGSTLGSPGGATRSVAEKKEMLGQWLGNVDQLVQGVEKVGFWAKSGAENAA